jgi:DNA repair exonuclease SbcCD ATPase subunit
MNKLDFKYLSARNFMCYGPEGIEIDLTKLSNIIHVRGDNLDVANDDERCASNGSGKTSIVNIIVYTLFGKTINEKVKHGDVIHNKVGKGLVTEVQWDKYRVVRGRKPDFLRIWESEQGIWDDSTEITVGGMPATQIVINDKVGLSYEAFVNVVVFTDNNKDCFLECGLATKRTVIDNLLSLSKYRDYSETAKGVKAEYKERLKLMSAEYERLLIEANACVKRIAGMHQQEQDWRNKRSKELSDLVEQIKAKNAELNSSDSGAKLAKYNHAQEQLAILTEKLAVTQSKKEKVDNILDDARGRLDVEREKKHEITLKYQELAGEIAKAKSEIKIHETTISSFENKKGTKCPACLGVVKEDNWHAVLTHAQNVIDSKRVLLEQMNQQLVIAEQQKNVIEANVAKLSSSVKMAEQKLLETESELGTTRKEIAAFSKIDKPETGSAEKVIESQISELKRQAIAKNEEMKGPSPFVLMIQSAEKEHQEKQAEVQLSKAKLDEADKELPYYDFWVSAFGDSGIRRFIIDGIVPALNSKVNHWLQFLIDGKIRMKFNNELEETIERNPADGDAFVYHAMSGGERRRVNLAVSQSFAHMMTLSYGSSPSFVFLDEVSTNVDPIGVQGIYNMIVELAKDKKVFITTHDHDLLSLLAGCECINLVKKDGFTKLVSD